MLINNKLYIKLKQKTGSAIVAFFCFLILSVVMRVLLLINLIFPPKKNKKVNIQNLQNKYNKNYKIGGLNLKNNLLDLSIIIPCYNAEKFLSKCLNSVINQKTNFNYEIIVINDGSTDATAEILSKTKASNLTVITTTNGGPGKARNIGIENAAGKYLAFVDADDFVEENFVEKLLYPAINGQLDMVVCGYKNISNNKIVEIKQKDREINVQNGQTFLTHGYPWGKVIKKSFFEKFAFPEGLAYEDTIMCYLIYPQVKTVKIIEDCLYNYIDNPTGQTNTTNNTNKALDSYYVFRYCIDAMQLGNLNFSPELYKFSIKTQCGSVLYSRIKNLDEKIIRELFELSAYILNCTEVETKLSLFEKRFKQVYLNYDFKRWKILSKFAKLI